MCIRDRLDIQKKSYRWFLETGLREVFKDVGSISDYAGNLELSFIDFSMKEKPKYNVETCKARDATYAAPIKVKVRLRNKETDEIKEQEIFMGDFPLITEGATFVITGADSVIVSQIVRSPGMYYNMEADKAGNISYSATVIPYRGAWLEYETDSSCLLYTSHGHQGLPVLLGSGEEAIACVVGVAGLDADAAAVDVTGIAHIGQQTVGAEVVPLLAHVGLADFAVGLGHDLAELLVLHSRLGHLIDVVAGGVVRCV